MPTSTKPILRGEYINQIYPANNTQHLPKTGHVSNQNTTYQVPKVQTPYKIPPPDRKEYIRDTSFTAI